MSISFNILETLIDAIKKQDMEEFNLILPTLHRDEINKRSPTGLSPIHYASLEGHIEMVESLIQNNADISLQDIEGWTPLHIAAAISNHDLAVKLLDFGADISLLNNDQETPFDVSENEKITLLLDPLNTTDATTPTTNDEEQTLLTALRKAHRMKNVSKWEQSLGISDEGSILHLAAAYGFSRLVEYICEEKVVSVNKGDCDAWTPLHVASYWQQTEIVDILLEYGANPALTTKVHYNRPCDL